MPLDSNLLSFIDFEILIGEYDNHENFISDFTHMRPCKKEDFEGFGHIFEKNSFPICPENLDLIKMMNSITNKEK